MVIYLIVFLLAFANISVFGYIRISKKNGKMTWAEANAACYFKHGTKLATISNYHDNANAQTVCGSNCWIGAKDTYPKNGKSIWKWVTQTRYKKLCYSNWHPGEPNSKGEKCVELISNGYWNDLVCSTKKKYAICNQPKYKLILCSETWGKANAYCLKKYGTTLATLNSREDAKHAAALCASSGNCWVGGIYRNEKVKGWVWAAKGGRVPMCYTNWKGSEPKNIGKKICVEVQERGKWNNLKCKYLRNALCNSKDYKKKKAFTPPGIITVVVDISTLISASVVLFLLSMIVATFVCYRKRNLAKMKKYVAVDTSNIS